MSRYVVIGAGAIGALLAGQFSLAGIETVLVARGANLDTIRRDGLRIRRPAGDDVVRLPVAAGPEEVGLRHDDVLVLAVKTQDAEAALARWAWVPVLDADGAPTLLGADLPVLTFQNGLATEDLALRRFSRVYGVTIGVAASHLAPGEVVSPSYPTVGVIWIGRHPDRHDDAQDAFAADLTGAGWQVDSVADISARKARKLLGNVANGLDILSGTPAEKDAARARVVEEAAAVLAAAGITPADPVPFRLTIDPVPGHVAGRLSTWQSFARGTTSEVDHLNGEIVLLARRSGVAAPLNERLQRLLGAQAERGDPPGTLAFRDLLDRLDTGLVRR